MIERYTLPEMGHVWSEAHKYELWCQVETLVLAAHAEAGTVPESLLVCVLVFRTTEAPIAPLVPPDEREPVFSGCLERFQGAGSRHNLTTPELGQSMISMDLATGVAPVVAGAGGLSGFGCHVDLLGCGA